MSYELSLRLSEDRQTLQLALEGGRFILKPRAHTFPDLPENEHVTMRIAGHFGIAIPPCALVELADGSIAYLVKRFDRTDEGRKLRQEDFCQLAEKWSKEKYDGSAELCVKLVKRHATEPLVALAELYRRLVFVWWTGNGDMHLKNFSLLATADGLQQLSPAYDLLCTRLPIPGDTLALPIGGKKDGLGRGVWRELASAMGLPPKAAARIHDDVAKALPGALDLVAASRLPPEPRARYRELLAERGARLGR